MRHFPSRKTMSMVAASTLASVGLLSSPAQALNIVLHPDSSFSQSPNGAAALLGFEKAANYWDTTLSNNVTLNFDIHFDSLGSGILGQTASNYLATSTKSVYQQLAATGNSTLDQIAVKNLPTLSAAGGIAYRTPGFDPDTGLTTAVTASSHYDNNDSINNLYMSTNTAINKALALKVDYSQSGFAAANASGQGYHFNVKSDADITFSSDFAFDFNPTDGVTTGDYDFVAVATHEMGHALGFVSGTDDYDYYIAAGGETAQDVDDTPELTTLDLFRLGATTPEEDNTHDIQLDPNRSAYFSVDRDLPFNFGGVNASSSFFATGEYNGDGSQASHWQDANAIFEGNGCVITDRQVGIMDPTSGACQSGIVTSNDLAAMDAMGWNLNGVDIEKDKTYTFDTTQIYDLAGLPTVVPVVPEPATWAMMMGGFGFVGAAIRRRYRLSEDRFTRDIRAIARG